MNNLGEYAPFIGLAMIAIFFGTMIYFAEKQQKQALKNTKSIT